MTNVLNFFKIQKIDIAKVCRIYIWMILDEKLIRDSLLSSPRPTLSTHEVLGKPPMYKDGKFFLLFHSCSNSWFIVTFPTAPHTEVTEKGEIKYSEVVRENGCKLEAYVGEMASGDTVSGAVNIQKVLDDMLKLWSVLKALPEISKDQKNRIKALYEGVVRSLHNMARTGSTAAI